MSTISPTINLDIILPNATDATQYYYDTHANILHLIDRVWNNPDNAGRIRSIGISFVSNDDAATLDFGRKIAAVLPLLRNIDTLRLDECLDYDFDILSSPLHFPRLTSLTCDIPPSDQFENFLALNPTIRELYLGRSADIDGYVDRSRKLSPQILPNLKFVECDIFLMGYYIPYHPVGEVMPRQAMDTNETEIEIALASLTMSTAGGGIGAGGGVTKLHLGHHYPLDRLALVAPNLISLYLFNEELEASSTPYGNPPNHFWTKPYWETYLGMFTRLREISVHTMLPFTCDAQKSLTMRWTTSRPAGLDTVTFECPPGYGANAERRWRWNRQLRGWVAA